MELYGLIVSIALERHTARAVATPQPRLSLTDVAQLLRLPNAPMAPPPTSAQALHSDCSLPSSLHYMSSNLQHPLCIVAALLFAAPDSHKDSSSTNIGNSRTIPGWRGGTVDAEFVEGVRDVLISVLLQQIEGWVEASRVMLPGRLPGSRPASARSRAWLCRCALALLVRALGGASVVEDGVDCLSVHARRVVECLLPIFGPDVAHGRPPVSLALHLDLAKVLGAALPVASTMSATLSRSPKGIGAARGGSSGSLADTYGPGRICQWALAWLDESENKNEGVSRDHAIPKTGDKQFALASPNIAGHGDVGTASMIGFDDERVEGLKPHYPQLWVQNPSSDMVQRSVHALYVMSCFKQKNVAEPEDALHCSILAAHRRVVAKILREVLRGPQPEDEGADFVCWLGCLATCAWPRLAELSISPTLSSFMSTKESDACRERDSFGEEADWLGVLHNVHLEAGKAGPLDELSIYMAQDILSNDLFSQILLHLLRQDTNESAVCFAAAIHVCLLLRLDNPLKVLLRNTTSCNSETSTVRQPDLSSNNAVNMIKASLLGLIALRLSVAPSEDAESNAEGSPDIAPEVSLPNMDGESVLADFCSVVQPPPERAISFISSVDSVGLICAVRARSIMFDKFLLLFSVHSTKGIPDFNSINRTSDKEAECYRMVGDLESLFSKIFVSASLRAWSLMCNLLFESTNGESGASYLRSFPLFKIDSKLPLRCFNFFMQVSDPLSDT